MKHFYLLPLCLAVGALGYVAAARLAPSTAVAEDAALMATAVADQEATSAAAWEPGALWRLYQEDWEFSLPPEYQGKTAGVDYNFVGSDKPLRHSAYLIDGLYDGLRDGWTSTSDEIALMSTRDFGFQAHPDPAISDVQPWKIGGERAAKILNHGAARAVVLADGAILRTSNGEIGPRRAELQALFSESACIDWTATMFQPGARVEFERNGVVEYATLDQDCHPVLPE